MAVQYFDPLAQRHMLPERRSASEEPTPPSISIALLQLSRSTGDVMALQYWKLAEEILSRELDVLGKDI